MTTFYEIAEQARLALSQVAFRELYAVLEEASLISGQGKPIHLALQLDIATKVNHLREALGLKHEEMLKAFGRNYPPTPEEIEAGRIGNVIPFEKKP